MSYILEALRKADADRERDRNAVPDLHAQLIPLTARPTAVDGDDHEGAGWWVLGAGVVAVLLLAGAGWWWFAGGEPARPTATGPTTANVASVAEAAGAASAPTAALAASAAAAAASAAAEEEPDEPGNQATDDGAKPKRTAPAVAKAEPKAKPAPVAKAAVKPRREPAAPSRQVAKAEAPAAKPAAPPAPVASPPPPAPPARVPALAELPESLRREVPAMSIGGSVYSPEAARRMVVINGQVFVEGSQLAPQLKLERIEPKSAVFSIRGERFALPL